MNIIFGNFGNDTMALLQWCITQKLTDLTMVSIDTGWAAPQWTERVTQAEQWCITHDIAWVRLTPKAQFVELMQAQKQFPSRKFQWCANFLKALPFLDWLDQTDIDPDAEATILLGRRREHGRSSRTLPERMEENEHFGDRRVWHPLYAHTQNQRDQLIVEAGFEVLPHRSLECDPCVNSDLNDVLRLDQSVVERTTRLEQTLGKRLLDTALYQEESTLAAALTHYTQKAYQVPERDIFEMGCGMPFGCGI